MDVHSDRHEGEQDHHGKGYQPLGAFGRRVHSDGRKHHGHQPNKDVPDDEEDARPGISSIDQSQRASRHRPLDRSDEHGLGVIFEYRAGEAQLETAPSNSSKRADVEGPPPERDLGVLLDALLNLIRPKR